MEKRIYDNFVRKYSLQRTLKFELKPIGKTMRNIEEKGFLEAEEKRADDYGVVKRLIDQYHKEFIECVMTDCKLSGLYEYEKLYLKANKDENDRKAFDNQIQMLRKELVKHITSNEEFKVLFSEKLVKEKLEKVANREEEYSAINRFANGFTTAFSGLHENRKNMYSDEEKSTAIAYRIINENLPKFMDNGILFKKIVVIEQVVAFVKKIETEMKDILKGKTVAQLFDIEAFNDVLTQSGIEKFNSVIGGYSEESGKKIKGLNEYINEFNQKNNEKIGKFKLLYKQILSDRQSASFLPRQFTCDEEVVAAIAAVWKSIRIELDGTDTNVSLEKIMDRMEDYDLTRVYLKNDQSMKEISQRLFGDWHYIQNALEKWYDTNYPVPQKGTEKHEEKRKKYLESRKSFSIQFIQKIIETEEGTKNICECLKAENTRLLNKLFKKYANCEEILNDKERQVPLLHDENAVSNIKEFLDSLKEMEAFLKVLLGEGTEADKDAVFYGDYVGICDAFSAVTRLYDGVRNYLTRKPYSVEKVKLYFNNPTLMDGWDKNKEEACTSLIFRKDGNYYLGVMDAKHRQSFRENNIPEAIGECYEKMEYKLLPGANKMLPKVIFSAKRIDMFAPSEEILRIYETGSFKKGDNFNLEECHKLIDFYKNCIQKHEDWSKFEFRFSDTKSYKDISGFYREVEKQGYKVKFREIPCEYIEMLVDKGQLYLFQIYNKDFSTKSKGTPNLHTMYWKALFSEENLENVVYKLNGEAEIFFRRKSIPEGKMVVHKAYMPIVKRTNPTGPKSSFEYDLIKDRRYTLDKLQFHVPITMNFVSDEKEQLNEDANEAIRSCEDLHIIGIDRGERNLLYLTVIDMQGNIVEQVSLNSITNTVPNVDGGIKVDYWNLLNAKEESRKKSRESWQTIENIKELKSGYLSQVIHQITQLMQKYNAIIVLEDLNDGFVRGRQIREKQVYKNFERMLIEKLNYFVNKKSEMNQYGSLMNAYQLTNKFDSFKKLGKQSGFLFYVPAWNTSKIDPVTGFVNLLYPKYEGKESAKTFIKKFDEICFVPEENYFAFSFDYSNFTSKADGTITKWTVCSYGDRIINQRSREQNGNWVSVRINLSDEFKKLFDEYGIDYSENLQEKILEQTEKKFFERLFALLKYTLQIRNSDSKTGEDYLLSPVKGDNGSFFDSRICGRELPQDADANGAYNIARKGLMLVEQIKIAENVRKPKLSISNKEWLAFAQRKRG